MNDTQTEPPPLPPTPVLSYEIAAAPTPFWLARLICGLAIANGAVSAGYIAASRLPSSIPSPHAWSDLPVAASGLLLMAFGALGIFRVIRSRMGIVVSSMLLLLCNWAAQWESFRMFGPPDRSNIASTLVGLVDNASIPIFVVFCLTRQPIKGCFTSQGRTEVGLRGIA